MLQCYEKDVDLLSSQCKRVPKHTSISSQEGPPYTVRLLTWNINMLTGVDGRTSVEPHSVADVLNSLNCDVMAIQEAPVSGLDKLWSSYFVQPMKRMRLLDQLLDKMGYTSLRSPAYNPTLLATRLPVIDTHEGPVLDKEPVRSLNGTSIWSEVRAARYAELALPANNSLAVYATHLHHKDIEIKEGQDLPGVRKREMSVLLDHWQRSSSAAPAAATIVLGDFNQPRSQDYGAEEWDVIVAGLSNQDVAQPEDDGVDKVLKSAGFVCPFDEVGVNNNFAGRTAPPLTHWTGTAIDFAYINAIDLSTTKVVGTYVHYTPLSDHLPLITDLQIDPRNT